MKAYRMTGWKQWGEIQEIPVPEPGPGEVLLRMGGAGVCHSDLHIRREFDPESLGGVMDWSFPMTLGHENAGWVEGIGAGVSGLDVGQPVVAHPGPGCGRCGHCTVGETTYCESDTVRAPGIGRDGGLAEYMLAEASALLPLRDLEPWQAAPLTDAGLTPYGAVKRTLPSLTPADAAVVIGVGGLGHMAVAILRELCGATVIAVDSDPKARELASELGAHLCLPADAGTDEAVMEATGGLGARAIFDFVGVDETLGLATRIARRLGHIVVVGLGGGSLQLGFASIPNGCQLCFSMGGSRSDLRELVALAEAGRVVPRVTRFPLEETQSVLEKLERGELVGRGVIAAHDA